MSCLQRADSALTLKTEVQLILESFHETEAAAIREVDWRVLRESLEAAMSSRRLSRDKTTLQSTFNRFSNQFPIMTGNLLSLFCSCHFTHSVTELIERSLIHASLTDSPERLTSTVKYLQGTGIIPEEEYGALIEKAAEQCLEKGNLGPILESMLASPVGNLSKIMQEALDEKLTQCDEIWNPKKVLFSEQHSNTVLTGLEFHSSRIHCWHVEGKKLETVVKAITRNKFDFLINWKTENKRMIALSALLAWDLVSNQSTSVSIKQRILDLVYPQLSPGSQSEFSGACGALLAKMKFSQILSNHLKQQQNHGLIPRSSKIEMSQILTQMRSMPPQIILMEYLQYFDLGFMDLLATTLASLPIEDLSIPVIRDLQLIISSGVVSSVLAFFSVFRALLLDSRSQLPDQELLIKELQTLISSVHLALCGMQGTYLHAWLLTTVTSLIKLTAVRPELLGKIEPTFMTRATKQEQQETEQPHSPMDVLKLLQELLKVLQDSMNQMCLYRTTFGAEKDAAEVHFQLLTEFHNETESSMEFLITASSNTTKRILFNGGWKVFGSFLALPGSLHSTLRRLLMEFNGDWKSLIAWSRVLEQRGSLDGSQHNIKAINSALDVVISRHLNPLDSLNLLKLVLHYRYPNTDGLGAFLNQRTLKIAEQVYNVLRGSGDPVTLCEVYGQTGSHTNEKSVISRSDRYLRGVLEHLKGLKRLLEAIKEVESGRLRYLSGLLHNLSRALSQDISKIDHSAFLEVAGFGPVFHSTPLLSVQQLQEEDEHRQGSLESTNSASYLSRMICYLADVGDIISTMDDGPSEGYNYFAMLLQTPQEILSTLIHCAQKTEDISNSAKVADLLQVDLIQEILLTWMTPIHSNDDLESCRILIEGRIPDIPAMKALFDLAPVRIVVFCVLAAIRETQDSSKGKFWTMLEVLFSYDNTGQYQPIKNWLRTQIQRPNEQEPEIVELMNEGYTLRETFRKIESFYGETGPPDRVWEQMVTKTGLYPEQDEIEGTEFSEASDSVPISWISCMRIKDHSLACETASRRVKSWSIERAIEFYSLRLYAMECDKHKNRTRVVDFLHRLRLYQRILATSLKDEFGCWIDVDYLYQQDCAQLIRRLLTSDGLIYALDVIRHKDVIPMNLKFTVYAAYVQDLCQGKISQGKGPLQAIKFLKSLSAYEAFTVGMKVLAISGSLRFSRVLVQYLNSLKGTLTSKSVEQLEEIELGISALKYLPQQWSEKCSHLVERPLLIVESLIMAKQMALVKKMLEESPTLRDDKLLIYYARKALGLGPDPDNLPYFLQDSMTGSSSSYEYAPCLASYPSRVSMMLASSTPEAQTGVGLVPVRVLSGIKESDQQLRLQYRVKSIPDLRLFRVLLDLVSTPEISSIAANKIAADLANGYLIHSLGELDWTPVVAQQFREVVDICLEVLDYGDHHIFCSTSEGFHESENPISSTTTGSRKTSIYELKYIYTSINAYPGGPRTLRLCEAVNNHHSCLTLRTEIELLSRILDTGIQSSLLDLRDSIRCKALLDRLITAEQFRLSVEIAAQCSRDERPYWESWVTASIKEGNFLLARERVPYVFCIPSSGVCNETKIILEGKEAAVRLVKVLESTYPVDMTAFYHLHLNLKHSRLGGVFRASAKEMMKLINRRRGLTVEAAAGIFESPISHERHGVLGERATKKEMISIAASATLHEERMRFCEELLAAYAPSLLMEFMFRHGRGALACRVMFPIGMSNDHHFTIENSLHSRSTSLRESTPSSSITLRSRFPQTSEIESSVSAEWDHKEFARGKITMSSRVLRKSRSLPHDEGSATSFMTLPPLGQADLNHHLDAEPVVRGVNSFALAREIEDIPQLCDLSIRYGVVGEMVKAMVVGGSRGKNALSEVCTKLETSGRYQHLYDCQKALGYVDAAGETCLRLSWQTSKPMRSQEFLELARLHFQEALTWLKKPQWRGHTIQSGGIGLFVHLDRDQLSVLIERSSLQILINKELLLKNESRDYGSESPTPLSCSMFVEDENTPTEAEKLRRMKIVEQLLTKDFSLASHVIREFNIPSTIAYSNAVTSMTSDKKHKAILNLANSIKGRVTEQQFDQILFQAVTAYSDQIPKLGAGDWITWFAEGLVELMISPHEKIRALIKLNDLESAYTLAKEQGVTDDIKLVLDAAERDRDMSVLRKCEQILVELVE
eukprot:g6861.t1